MKMTLRFRPALLRTATVLAASAVAGSTSAQAPPGMVGDPFAAGAYAVPMSGPVAVAYQDAGATLSDPMLGGGLSGPTAGGPVYMAPQVIGGGVPGSPGCNCGPGGTTMMSPPTGSPMMGAPMTGSPTMGGTMIDPSMGMGMPMPAPTFGGVPAYSDPYAAPGTGCCLTDSCLGSCFGMCDPCAPAVPPVCDPCQTGLGYSGGGGGLYHGAGGTQRYGWATGFSWVFLKPFYGANEAISVTNFGPGGFTTSGRDFDYSLDLSPRVFVEYVARNDLGVRATWFGFESDADGISQAVPGGSVASTPLDQNAVAGQTISANSGFDIDTIDLDLTQRLQVRRSLVNVGAGVRWAGYDHTYTSSITGAPGSSNGSASRQFDGVGPTVFAEWRRPIGSTRFSLLANIRGSMLFGEAETESVVQSPLGSTFSSSQSDDFVAIGETQLGGEWSAWISQRTVLFVQVAWETQYWLGVGTALDRNDDLGLFGFNTTVGLEW